MTWGSLGTYEYSAKGLPHCLMHARELVETGGHHAAYNTATAEAAHPGVIKTAAQFSQTRASLNETHEHMLAYVCWQRLWKAVIERSEATVAQPQPRVRAFEPLTLALAYTEDWPRTKFYRGLPPAEWKSTFISQHVLVTREELVSFLLHKLGIDDSRENFQSLVTNLRWQCYGAWCQRTADGRRAFVGLNPKSSRRDFVRLRGTEADTALTGSLQMFVKISGFGHGSGIFLPANMSHDNPDSDSCVFAVIRWLSPHPDALLRDSKSRPICSAPFDINHALWTFSKRGRVRSVFRNRANIRRQLQLFPGPDRLDNAYKLQHAMYDMVQVQTIEHLINCTTIDDSNSILETLVLPF